MRMRSAAAEWLAAGLAAGLALPAAATEAGVKPAAGPTILATAPAPAADPVAVLGIIDAAIAAGRLEAARDIIARAAPANDGPKLRLRAAELALANNALAEAATSFAALVNDPGVGAAAYQGLGLVRLRQDDLPAAIAALDAAVGDDPGLFRAWNARGVIADRARDFIMAEIAYGHALGVAPASAMVLTNHGWSLLLRGSYAEAEAELARALAIEPALAVARTNLRLARALQGRYKDAFAGSTPDALATDLNTVGFAAMARGDYLTAETYFNRALSKNSRFDAIAWANLRYLKAMTDPLPDRAPDPDRK